MGATVARRFKPPAEPLVERNPFRQGNRAPCQIPTFDELRSRLPAPVLPEDAPWEQLYWAAWETLWQSLYSPPAGSSLIAGYFKTNDENNLEMGDEAFIAQLSGYIPGSFNLIEILDNFYAGQHDDGFICRAQDGETGEDVHQQPYEPNSSGPNLLAWAEWRHFRLTGDKERVAAVFWPLLAYHRWCRANRTWPNGLYWTTAYSSGLVNQPRVPAGRYHHQHWAWIDASAQAAVNGALLERMAILLDEQEFAQELAAEHANLAQAINTTMWNQELAFYQDIAPDDRFSPVRSIAAYWTLVDPQLVPRERVQPFIQHLRDAWSFSTQMALPSLAADSEAYNGRTGNGWRGAVWSALTYMVLRGLQIAEQPALASKLAVNHVEAVCRVFEQTGSFWNNYAPEEIGPGDPAVVDRSGQTPAALIAMVLEDILGLSVDWPLRQVTWRRFLDRTEGYGVRNLPLGNEGSVDIIGTDEVVRIRTDSPFTLAVHDSRQVIQAAVPAGNSEITLK
jgi:hypothetical protein